MASMKDSVRELEKRRAKLQPGGDTAAIEKQHNRGKLTAWERIMPISPSPSLTCCPWPSRPNGWSMN